MNGANQFTKVVIFHEEFNFKKKMKAKILLILSLLLCVQFAEARRNRFKAQEQDSVHIDTTLVKELGINPNEQGDSLFVEERPEESYEEVVYTPRKSILHIPIEINMALAEKIINENFKGLIYEDNNIEDDSLMTKAWKEQDFKITYDGNVLTYVVPIRLWIKKRFDLGITTTDREIEGSISMTFKTKIAFSKDWGIVSDTKIVDYKWLKSPTIKIVGLNVPITMIAEKLIKDYQGEIGKAIDKSIMKYIPLKEYVLNIWKMVQDPIDISTEEYKAWIRTTPQQIYSTPIQGEYGILKTTVGIHCLMEVFMGKAPKAVEKSVAIPPYKQFKGTDEKFAINILGDIPFEMVDSVAKSIMIGETFGEGRHQITVDSIEVYGQNDQLIIGLQVSGFIKGNIYLNGTPYFNQENSSIQVKDVDFKISTKNLLAKIVNLFYKRGLKRKLEENLVFSLKEELSLVKEMTRSELFNMEIMKNVRLNGILETLNVNKIFLTQQGIKVDLDLKGKMSVKMQ